MQANQTSTRDDREQPRRSNAGCPPALLIDLTHTEDLGPQVEWPPAPPSRHAPHDVSPTTSATPPRDVADLTTGRAVHLLDATIAHLRTALEVARHDDEADRLERAISDIARARETLGPLAG